MGMKSRSAGDRATGLSEPRASTCAYPSAIELHIEELVLHGFQAGARRIGEAIEQELARLLTEPGLSDPEVSPINIERIDAGAINVAAGAMPRAIGVQLAQNLHGSLVSRRKTPRMMRVKERQRSR